MYFNIAGNSKWVHAMEWSGQKDFGAAATVPFKVDGAETGQIKSHGPLTFLKVSFCLFLEYVCLSVHAMLSNFEIFSAFFKTNFEIFFCIFQNKQVHDAGHMVPMDQPKASLQMLQSWMHGKLAMTWTDEKIYPK